MLTATDPLYPGQHHSVAEFIHTEWDRLFKMDKHMAFTEVFSILRSGEAERFVCPLNACDLIAFHHLLPHGTLASNGPDIPIWYFRFDNCKVRGRQAFATAFPKENWPEQG